MHGACMVCMITYVRYAAVAVIDHTITLRTRGLEDVEDLEAKTWASDAYRYPLLTGTTITKKSVLVSKNGERYRGQGVIGHLHCPATELVPALFCTLHGPGGTYCYRNIRSLHGWSLTGNKSLPQDGGRLLHVRFDYFPQCCV